MQTRIDLRTGKRIAAAARVQPESSAQDLALDRLVSLLEDGGATPQHNRWPHRRSADPLSRLARLQAARAHYALRNGGEMTRVAPGAYMRDRGPKIPAG